MKLRNRAEKKFGLNYFFLAAGLGKRNKIYRIMKKKKKTGVLTLRETINDFILRKSYYYCREMDLERRFALLI